MNTITFSSLKGGVGKSSHTIATANRLGAGGEKVLVIDMDLNNSVSSYYLDDETKELIGERNIAAALAKPTNNLRDYIVPTRHRRVDLIPSSLYLIDLRGLSERRLSQLLPSLGDEYDEVIIDTQPTYDNLVLNAIEAADLIITPANLSLFDYNAAMFMRDKISMETDKAEAWFVHINGYNRRFERAKRGSQKEYVELFKEAFNMTPAESWTPWTPSLRAAIDRDMRVSREPLEGCIASPRLYAALNELAECFLPDDKTLGEAEAF